MSDFNLHPLDLTIILIYIVGIIWWGLNLSRKKSKNENQEDYFLAGRSMKWPIVGITLFAANMGSPALVGLAGDAYSTGISVFNYEWMAVVVLVFFAIFFLPFYLRSRVYTMPEFLERRFDSRSRYYLSFVTLIGNVVIDTAGVLYSGALIVKMIFPQLDLWQIISILAIITAAYTITGGLTAVLYTEAVQGILLVVGAILVSFFAFQEVGFDWNSVLEATPPEMLSLIRPMDDPSVPWLGLLTGVPLLGFYFWCTNQFMVQRVLSAKNVDHGRWGSLLAGFMKLPVIFILVFPGTIGRVIYPDLEQPDLIYPTLLFNLLPIGVLGIVLAGLIAAISSSISATLNSASTLVTMDFVSKLNPNLKDKQLVFYGKIFTGVFVVISAAWAPQIANFDSLFKYLQQVLALIAPPIVAVFFAGVFWRRTNANGAFAGLMSGFVTAIILVLLRYFYIDFWPWIAELHFLFIAPMLFVITTIVIVITSLIGEAQEFSKIEDLIWTKKIYDQETRDLKNYKWYTNYRTQSIIILIITAIVVYLLR